MEKLKVTREQLRKENHHRVIESPYNIWAKTFSSKEIIDPFISGCMLMIIAVVTFVFGTVFLGPTSSRYPGIDTLLILGQWLSFLLAPWLVVLSIFEFRNLPMYERLRHILRTLSDEDFDRLEEENKEYIRQLLIQSRSSNRKYLRVADEARIHIWIKYHEECDLVKVESGL